MKRAHVKILEVDREEIEQQLEKLDADKSEEYEVKTHYYGHRGKAPNVTIRLQRGREGTTLLHEKKAYSGEPEKTHLEVSDLEKAREMLSNFGLREMVSTQKRCVTYSVEEVHITFDKHLGKHDHVPEYVKIEGRDLRTVQKTAEQLGFEAEQCKQWTGRHLIRHYAQ